MPLIFFFTPTPDIIRRYRKRPAAWWKLLLNFDISCKSSQIIIWLNTSQRLHSIHVSKSCILLDYSKGAFSFCEFSRIWLINSKSILRSLQISSLDNGVFHINIFESFDKSWLVKVYFYWENKNTKHRT